MPTTINIFPPNAFVISQSSGATYDLLAANVVTGVVTSAVLPANTTNFLTVRLQALLAALPGLSSTALQSLIRNLVGLNQLEGAFTAAVGVVGNVYTLTLSGLNTPSSMQVSIGFSMISPFVNDGSNAGGGGSAGFTLNPVDANAGNANNNGSTLTGSVYNLNVVTDQFPGVMSATQYNSFLTLGALPGGSTQTTDATPTDINCGMDASQVGLVFSFEAHITAQVLTGGDCAGYGLAGVFQNAAGVVSKIGTTQVIYSRETDAAWACDFSIVGDQVMINVTGALATTINWFVSARLLSQVSDA